MRSPLHARLRARLQNREPGLLGLPLPLPSVPLLSPALTPLVGNNPPQASQGAPQPAPAPPPAPAPQQPPASPNQPASGSGKGKDGSSDPPPDAGGNSGKSGTGTDAPPGNGNGKNGIPLSVSGWSSNSVPGSPPQAQPSSDSPLGSAIPPSPSGASPGSVSDGSIHLVSSTAAGVASTGVVVAMPINNEAAVPTSSSISTPSDVVQGAVGASSGVAMALTPSITSGSSLNPLDSSHGSLQSPNAGNGNGGNGTDSGSTGDDTSFGSRSQLSSGAIGGIITLVILCGIVVFYVLRKRYLSRKAERQVQWINGYIGGESPNMLETQRCTSMRSSWGTPIEHRFSDPFQLIAETSTSHMHEGTYKAESSYTYTYGDAAPVLPMPVHSPIEDRYYTPENPFADGNSSPHPIKQMASLPIRISLISEGSGNPDPFDDSGGYVVNDHVSESGISSATFGRGSEINCDAAHGTQANFPMPPTSASSAATVFAIGTPSQLLEPPGILISFPDSAVSPTFAASGTLSYPRRASVKVPYLPTRNRRDEVLLDKGDQVNVVSVYEDGWAFVQNEKRSEHGLVPLNCLEIDNP